MANPYPNFKEIREKSLVDSNSGLNVHDHLKGHTIPELQEVSKNDRLPWHTMALNLTGDLNIGTIIRTSHCLGATSVVIIGRSKVDNRSLVGSANYIKVDKVPSMMFDLTPDPEVMFKALEDRNLTPVFCESNGISLPKANWTLRLSEMSRRGTQPCLIMGNETGGIPSSILDIGNSFPNSFTVSIPQRGVIRSLNVAVAHGIIAGDLCSSMGWM